MRLPWFLMPASDPILGGTLTISFWLKFTNNGGFIFRFYSQDTSYDYFSVFIRGAGYITILTDSWNSQLTADEPITLSEWTIVTITIYTYESTDYYSVYADEKLILYTRDSTYRVSTDPNDIVVLGGPNCFLGSLSNFRIFNSGSAFISDASILL